MLTNNGGKGELYLKSEKCSQVEQMSFQSKLPSCQQPVAREICRFVQHPGYPYQKEFGVAAGNLVPI